MQENLETRVAAQFSTLYLTLVSVLVGLVLADLFSTIHARMVLWPLTLETGRTWCQILGNSFAVWTAWLTYAHLGLLRKRVPTIWDSVDAALVLVVIPLNAATGLHDATAWFFWAGAYCCLGVTAVNINLWQSKQEPVLRELPRIGRIGGPYTTAWLGAPAYFAIAAASYLHRTTPLFELIAAAGATIAALIAGIWFMRDWRRFVASAAMEPTG
jgi:hypothetical protein